MARQFKNKFGVTMDLTRAESIEVRVRPNARWYSLVAVLQSGMEMTILTEPEWHKVQHMLQRLTVELLQRGKDMKIDEETGNLVVDYGD